MNNFTNKNSTLNAAIILALSIAGFFIFIYFQEKEENEVKSKIIKVRTEELNLANLKLDSLSRELDIKISELAALGVQVEGLEKLRVSLQRDKQDLRVSANSIDVSQYTSRISEYELILREKEEELQRLRLENNLLGDENKNISSKNIKLTADNTNLKTRNDALSDTVTIYVRANNELQEKVNIAAALRAQGYLITAVNKRGREKDGDQFKGKKVDRIKVSFKLALNSLTKKENKVIYFRLLDPTGNVIADMALGSGTFTFGGKQTVYTAQKTINYTNTNQVVDFVHDRESRYERGPYTVELYSEGIKIGQTSFAIK
jgi:hypothetical protein